MGVPLHRIIVLRDLYWGPALFLGKYHIETLTLKASKRLTHNDTPPFDSQNLA